MSLISKLRVLVIDDSAYNRQIISDVLGEHADFEVIGKAEDGEQGLKLAALLKPDLITLDVEMPRMDGFTFLRLLMSQMPTPVIVISSHSKKQEVFQALELGALDFIAKPARYLQPEIQGLKEEIIQKATAVKALQIIPLQRRSIKGQMPLPNLQVAFKEETFEPRVMPLRVVCIGASTGGPPALQSLLKVMVANTPTAFLIAQHMPEKFTRAFAERLNRVSPLTVIEAEDGMPVIGGRAYIAPGGGHMEVVETGGLLFVSIKKTTTEDRYVPSIDRLFASLARVRGPKVLTAVLTGMGSDGSVGIRDLHHSGARILAESQESAIVFGMPKEAIQTQCVHEVLSLESIIERIHQFATGASKT